MAKGRIAELVGGYRATIADNPEPYQGDELATMIMWLLDDTRDRTWTPSEVGRAVGVGTARAYDCLTELVDGRFIQSDNRGAWTRYWSGARG